MYSVRPASYEDVDSISQRLREADIREVEATGGNPLASLRSVLSYPGAETFVAVNGQEVPQVIFGVVPHPSETFRGNIWMLATDDLDTHAKQLLRETPFWLKVLQQKYQVLSNYVYAENTAHLRWIKWAGFSVINKVSINNAPFYEFAMIINSEVTDV